MQASIATISACWSARSTLQALICSKSSPEFLMLILLSFSAASHDLTALHLSVQRTTRSSGIRRTSSAGSMSSASAIRPITVTLAETSARSIAPTYRALKPARSATSSCVRSRAWRNRRKFVAIMSFRSILQRNRHKNDRSRNDHSYSTFAIFQDSGPAASVIPRPTQRDA